MRMDETIYRLTVADVAGVYEEETEESWGDLTEYEQGEYVDMARKYIEGHMQREYGWYEVILDAIWDVGVTL